MLGLGWGLLVVSFASSIGATLSFLMARFVLQSSVQARFGARLAEFNLAMGLTAMRARTFYGVSQLGMLAGTAVYVNAGTQLVHIHSLKDVVSPGLLGSFVLLGIFPLLARRQTQNL